MGQPPQHAHGFSQWLMAWNSGNSLEIPEKRPGIWWSKHVEIKNPWILCYFPLSDWFLYHAKYHGRTWDVARVAAAEVMRYQKRLFSTQAIKSTPLDKLIHIYIYIYIQICSNIYIYYCSGYIYICIYWSVCIYYTVRVLLIGSLRMVITHNRNIDWREDIRGVFFMAHWKGWRTYVRLAQKCRINKKRYPMITPRYPQEICSAANMALSQRKILLQQRFPLSHWISEGSQYVASGSKVH